MKSTTKLKVCKLDLHASVHRDTTMKITNKLHYIHKFVIPSRSPHVSSEVFAHHQEHLTVFTVSGSIQPSCCRLASWMSWKLNYVDFEACIHMWINSDTPIQVPLRRLRFSESHKFAMGYLQWDANVQPLDPLHTFRVTTSAFKYCFLTHWGRGNLNCLNARSRGF